jgi:hypothetical protein
MTIYNKWFLEVVNQEYKGNIKLFTSRVVGIACGGGL